jgi:CRISPR-associated endoribonuclease Cas6
MRIKITLQARGDLDLPVHYNALIQGLVYDQLEPNLAKWLHGEAYRVASRMYKMLTFSRLFGSYRHEEGRIRFTGPVSFLLASYNAEVLCSLAEHLLRQPEVRLGKHLCQVVDVAIVPAPRLDFRRPVRVKALSPITVYSTLNHADGRKRTYYYEPAEEAWSEMLLANLARKAAALDWEDSAQALAASSVLPYRVSGHDRKIIRYKDNVVKAWLGVYELRLPEGYFWLAYDVGLGGKNGQGFGMVEVV